MSYRGTSDDIRLADESGGKCGCAECRLANMVAMRSILPSWRELCHRQDLHERVSFHGHVVHCSRCEFVHSSVERSTQCARNKLLLLVNWCKTAVPSWACSSTSNHGNN